MCPGLICCDLELLNTLFNELHTCRKKTYMVIQRKLPTYADVEDLDDQQFIIHEPVARGESKQSELFFGICNLYMCFTVYQMDSKVHFYMAKSQRGVCKTARSVEDPPAHNQTKTVTISGDNHDRRSTSEEVNILEENLASLRSINEVPHISAMVARKRVLISEETIQADLLFDDADGVDCMLKPQVLLKPQGLLLELPKVLVVPKVLADNSTIVPMIIRPTDASQTSEGEEGLYGSICSKTGSKKRGQKQKKKVSSVKLGRNKDEGNLSEEHHDQDDHNHTAFVYEDPDLERKSDETEQLLTQKKKGKGILIEEPKKKKLSLQQTSFGDFAHDEEVASERSSRNGMHKKKRKRLED
ncbi:hypothetical protein Tco_1549477 [Tanacetum coccineum]